MLNTQSEQVRDWVAALAPGTLFHFNEAPGTSDVKRQTLACLVSEPCSRLKRVASDFYHWTSLLDADGAWVGLVDRSTVTRVHLRDRPGCGWAWTTAASKVGLVPNESVALFVAVLQDKDGHIPQSPMRRVRYLRRGNYRRAELNWAEVSVLEALRSGRWCGDVSPDGIERRSMFWFTRNPHWGNYGDLVNVERLRWAAEGEPVAHRKTVDARWPEVVQVIKGRRSRTSVMHQYVSTMKPEQPEPVGVPVTAHLADDKACWVVQSEYACDIARVEADDALGAVARYLGCGDRLPVGEQVEWDTYSWDWSVDQHQPGVSAKVALRCELYDWRGERDDDSSFLTATRMDPSWPVPIDDFFPWEHSPLEGNWLVDIDTPANKRAPRWEWAYPRTQADSGVAAIASFIGVNPYDLQPGSVHDFGSYGPYGREVSKVTSVTINPETGAAVVATQAATLDSDNGQPWEAIITATPADPKRVNRGRRR